jgi:hypothetical protein
LLDVDRLQFKCLFAGESLPKIFEILPYLRSVELAPNDAMNHGTTGISEGHNAESVFFYHTPLRT